MKNNGGGFDDLEKLRIHPEYIPTRMVETDAIRRRRAKQRRAFVMRPLEWSHRLARATCGATNAVADCVLYLSWKSKGEPVTLSNVALENWRVSPREKSRAIAELEELGLITVERRRRRSPLVTVLKV